MSNDVLVKKISKKYGLPKKIAKDVVSASKTNMGVKYSIALVMNIDFTKVTL